MENNVFVLESNLIGNLRHSLLLLQMFFTGADHISQCTAYFSVLSLLENANAGVNWKYKLHVLDKSRIKQPFPQLNSDSLAER